MNRKLIQKVIDAIKDGKLEYAMGILDTIIESLPEEPKGLLGLSTPIPPVHTTVTVDAPRSTDEGSMLDAVAAATIEKIKRMSEASNV